MATSHFQYDAFGNLVIRQEPGEVDPGTNTAEWVEYTFDGLSRETEEQRIYDLGADTEIELQFFYDGQETGSGCPSSSSSYTLGRLQMQTDSFGQTWMVYDEDGRLLEEERFRNYPDAGASGCSSINNYYNPNTTYAYDGLSNLTSVTSPYGREATYVYGSGGSAKRVSSINLTYTDGGGAWLTDTGLITNISWEPYGGLRAYQLNTPWGGGTETTSVYYFREGAAATAPSAGCPEAIPSASSSDNSGRITGIFVLDGGLNLTNSSLNASSSLYAQRYTWSADQIVQTDTCLAGDPTDRSETFFYDQTLRLVGTDGGGGDSSPYTHRGFSYDVRGNRTQMVGDVSDCTYSDTYGSSNHPDWLTEQASSCSNDILAANYAYAQNGNVSAITLENNSSAPAATYSLTNGPGGNGSGSSDTVFRALSVGGVTYNYFYDAKHRRRRKSYPVAGVNDEYFYSPQDEMIVDQGNDSSTSPTEFVVEDYVWLDGRPVIVERGTVNHTTYVRNEDSRGICNRYGDGLACGTYFPITDPIGKPIAMIDQGHLLAGVGEYDSFGRVNRMLRDKETPHPYYPDAGGEFASFGEPPTTGIVNQLRVHYQMVDLREQTRTCSGSADTVTAVSGTVQVDSFGNVSSVPEWGNWITSDGGSGQVEVILNLNGAETTVGGVCTADPYTKDGVVIEGYAYRRYQPSTATYWIPLGFPGQSYDAESDLYQNWNRFYDPSIGRYLEPDPLAGAPNYLRSVAMSSLQTPIYSYAADNPVTNSDPSGLMTLNVTSAMRCSSAIMQKWVDAFDIVQSMAKSCSCATAFQNEYHQNLASLLTYSTPNPVVQFGATSNGALGEQQGNTITLSCSAFAGNSTAAGLADILLHELGHWANPTGGSSDDSENGASPAELACYNAYLHGDNASCKPGCPL